MLEIISGKERVDEQRGGKVLLVGPPGVGKTSLLHTLEVDRTLFAESESGDLAVRDVPVATVRIPDWPTARDLAVRIAGPNKSFASSLCYSAAHFEAVGGELPDHGRYTTIFFDSITDLSRKCLRYCEQQPDAFSERTGNKDVRGAYGLLAREMLMLITHLQHVRSKNIVFVGILERATDEFNRAGEWRLQCEGAKTARELPGIVDQIITYQFLDFGDGNPTSRGFVCTPNAWQYPAKDRSGRLNQIEPPDLGKLLNKLTQNSKGE